MKNSNIEWTDHTFNPWEGCTKVSPGCAHCYAEARNQRFAGGANWGPGAPRRRTKPDNWKQPLKWNREAGERAALFPNIPWARAAMDAATHRPRVFCASLADWLDDEVPLEWLTDLLWLICQTPNLDWLLLTKRPQNWRSRLQAARAEKMQGGNFGPRDMVEGWLTGTPPANVWIGTTVEDQQRADERIPLLLLIPAHVRFLSCEPLLGPVDLLIDGECSSWKCPECGSANVDPDRNDPNEGRWWYCPDCKRDEYGEADWTPDVHWVICGGESGPGARPMHPDWARSLRDQCAAAGVPFFFKQWGEWVPCGVVEDETKFPRQLLEGTIMCRIGKLAAGRMLDGVEHNAAP